MKRLVIILMLLFAAASGLWAQQPRKTSLALHIFGGGRYDNVRMCVASPAGVPGGPIGEFYLDIRVPVSKRGTVVFDIPLFRPIVFAAAFQMLQLEPLAMYEHVLGKGNGTRPVIGGGLGAIFHYGPDYRSSLDNRGESFFSIGPLFNGFAGLTLGNSNFTAGIKIFVSPLFTPGRTPGLVAGGGIGVSYTIKRKK